MKLSFEIADRTYERAELGESPCWDPDTNELWWVDITGKRLLRSNLATDKTEAWKTPELAGFVVLTAPGVPAIGMQSGIFAFNPGSGAFTPLVLVDRPGCRFNDATVDAHGRLWASIMEVDAQAGCAAIYLATADLELVTVVDGLSIPNGLAVDLDRQKFFYSDSHPDVQSIWVKPIDGGSGLPGEATLFASTTRLNGRPDGASLDQWGYYWIAGVDGSELYVYGSDGGLHDTIVVPVPAPTKICFAGQNGRTVLVTSKNIGENGGYLARAELPPGMPSGVAQPYWDIGAR